jgi:hypothetical protein
MAHLRRHFSKPDSPNANGAVPNGKPHLIGTAQPGLAREERTDYSRWRLLDEQGRQTWHYLTTDEEIQAWPQTVADKFHLGLPTVRWPTSLPSSIG